MKIRKAQKTDIKKMAALDDKGLLGWSAASLESAIKSEYAFLFVAEEEEEIVGYILSYLVADEGEIPAVIVSKDRRQQGIGFMLLRKVKKEAKAQEVKKIFLEVRKSNLAAQALYQKAGFFVCATRKNFYDNPSEDGIVMQWNME